MNKKLIKHKDVGKYLFILVGLIIMTIILLPGAIKSNNNANEGKSETAEAYFDKIKIYADTPITASELDAMLNKEIMKGSVDLATISVDLLMNAMLNNMSKYEQMLTLFSSELKLSENSVEELLENPELAKSQSLKGFLVDINNNYLTILEVNGDYFVESNTALVYKKYGNMVSEDLKDVLNYMMTENYKDMFLNDSKTFNVEYLGEKIHSAEEMMIKHKDSLFVVNVLNRMVYYYEVVLGMSHNEFVDNNLVYKTEYIETLQKQVDLYPNSELSANLESYLLEIKKANNIRTANVDVFTQDLVSKISKTVSDYESSANKALEKNNQ